MLLDLLVHTVYTNFWPFFNTPEIYRPLCKVLWRFDQKWPNYRPPKCCLICWYIRYTPFFYPFLASLRYADHCLKVLWRFDQNWPSYRPSKWCQICWCMRYTLIFCPLLAPLRYTKHCVIWGILGWGNFVCLPVFGIPEICRPLSQMFMAF